MISKGSHLVVIIRIISTGLHDRNIAHSSIRLLMNRKNYLKSYALELVYLQAAF